MGFTLVLGGGVAGIAWMAGLLAGLADTGQNLTDADALIGTSAGATIATQVACGLTPAEMYARQVDPALQSREITPTFDIEEYMASLGSQLADVRSAEEGRQVMGRLALAADTVPEADRLAVIASRLPIHTWPTRPLSLVAVDAETGEPVVFTRTSGVDLVTAVAASSAVPGVWPPVTINGRRYIDGGVRTGHNADYATGASRVVIIAPMGVDDQYGQTDVVADLRASGADVTVIVPDEASLAAFGTNPLDAAVKVPAAEAGRAQGRAL
ncbi:patatin-like phospholipase family protein [Kibdelosporangium lantanae]